MMKYILVLILFGFSSMSFAHDEQNEEEKWISCVEKELDGDFVCHEINVDKITRIEYSKYTIKYFTAAGKISIATCDSNIRTGKHCSDIDLDEGVWKKSTNLYPTD